VVATNQLAKCLRFGLWLTLCTLRIHLLNYLLTCLENFGPD